MARQGPAGGSLVPAPLPPTAAAAENPPPPPPLLLLQVIRQPDDALLAFLLGNAIGVMFLLSVAEMWVANAAANGWPEITVAFGLGALLYQVAQPFIPDFSSHVPDHSSVELDKVRGGQASLGLGGRAQQRC
jgi:hypothetical protein